MNLVDLLIIIIILASVIISGKIGFIKTALGLLSMVISISLASATYPLVADYLKEGTLGSVIEEKVEMSMREKAENEEESEKKKAQDEEKMSLLPSNVQETIKEGAETVENTVVETAAKAVSTIVINIISMVIVFVVVRVLMFIITHTLKFISKLPVIKNVNCILGGAIGAVYGVLIVYILLAVLAFNAAFGSGAELIKPVKDSYVGSFMYDNNFIVNLVSGK